MRFERWPSIVALRLRTLLHRADVERELDDEVRYHIDRQTEDNVTRGMSPEAARRAALVAFGGAERVKEDTRDRFRHPLFAELAQDARFAWRMMKRTPVLTSVVVLTVGVAVALTTTAFSAVDGVLLRALPYSHADRLVLIWGRAKQLGDAELDPVSFTNAMDWRRDVKAVESLATFSCTPRPILSARDEPVRATRMEVSLDFFALLEAKPFAGRLFDSSDFAPGASPAMVVTYALWRDRLGSNPSAVGSKVLVDGEQTTVVGVLPRDFAAMPTMLACHPEIYRPLGVRYDDMQRSWSFLKAVGRLAPGASLEQAQAQLDVVNARLAAEFPASNSGRGARIVRLSDYVLAPLRGGLLLVQAGAILILLIASTNIAGLLLTRAAARQRELGIRLALGAGALRLARQTTTECAMLGVIAAAVGALLTVFGASLTARIAGDAFPDPRGLTTDWRVGVFGVAAALVATAVFTAAAIFATVGDPRRPLSWLRDGGHVASSGRPALRRAIVALQFAMATLVLVAAGLLARSYARLLDVRPGLDPGGVVTARITLPDALYPRGARQVRFFREVIGHLSLQPDITAVGATSVLPDSPNFDRTNATVVGRVYAPGEELQPDVYRVTPGYFDALRIPLVAGRRFFETDDDQHPLVAIINETMARSLFPGESAVGKRIWSGAGQSERTIVGVVGDTYQYGLDKSRTMQLYVPHADNSGGDLTLVVRWSDDSRVVSAALRDAVRSVDPGVPVDEIQTMNEVLSQSNARRRLLAELALAFALGAIGLAAVGLYGVIAYGVSQRTAEIGLRMALGATAAEIVSRVMRDVGRIVVAGMALGVVLALALVRLIAPLLFGVSAGDPMTFGASCATLLVVAILAATVPAGRAAAVSPAIALRGD